jgi:hypothetical protein
MWKLTGWTGPATAVVAGTSPAAVMAGMNHAAIGHSAAPPATPVDHAAMGHGGGGMAHDMRDFSNAPGAGGWSFLTGVRFWF